MRIIPQGNDRSWTRNVYNALNKFVRYTAYKHNLKKKVSKATLDMLLYGDGTIKL